MILFHGSYKAIEKPDIQYCFRNQDVINKYLIYAGMETL